MRANINYELLAEVYQDIDIEQSEICQPEYRDDIMYVDIHGNRELLDKHRVEHDIKKWAFESEGYITECVYAGKNSTCIIKDFIDDTCHLPPVFENMFQAGKWILENR